MAYVAVRIVASFLCFLFIAGSTAVAQTTSLPAGFELVPEATGLNLGVAFASAPGGRLFIAEKGGVVRVLAAGTLLSEPFIDISREVNNVYDRGLLGITLHPSFPEQPYVYLLYTYDPPETEGRTGLAGPDQGGARVARLLRVSADPAFNFNRALPGSGQVLLGAGSTFANIAHPDSRNNYAPPACGPRGAYVQDCIPADENSHTIGTVSFGPDGALYVGSGDGCSYINAQEACTRAVDVDSLAGKILRIDPITGRGLADNPFFVGDGSANRAKVWLLGLRNPFRFSFDRQAAQLYVGDVGWNTWEEVNRAGKGANFGWPCYEGGNGSSLIQSDYARFAACRALPVSAVTPPLYAYTHEGGGSSIQVGDVYRGTRYPPAYRGALFYSDYNRQQVRYLTFDTDGQVTGSQLLAEGVSGVTQMSAEPESGDMLIMRINFAGGAPTSSIERLRYVQPSTQGPLNAGVYRVRGEPSPGCLQAFPEEPVFLFFTRAPRAETRTCSESAAQRWQAEEVGPSIYRFVSRSQNQALTATSSDGLAPREISNAANQRFVASRLGAGIQLRSQSANLCVTIASSQIEQTPTLSTCSSTASQVLRFLPDGNSPPVLEPIADQTAQRGDTVQLIVAANDVDGDALTYFAEQLPPELGIDPETGLITGVLSTPGTFATQVRVTDGHHEVSTSFVFRVRDDRIPRLTIITPVPGTTYRLGERIPFSGQATDFEGNPLPPQRVSWTLRLHHNQHEHVSTLVGVPAAGGSFEPEDHGDGTYNELCLNGEDAQGRRAQVCRELRPIEVDYTIQSSPSGMLVSWEGVERSTPFTVRTQVGAARQVSAPASQPGYVFRSWSDGGEASHDLTVGETPTTLTVQYDSTAPSSGAYRLSAQHSGKCLTYRPATFFLFLPLYVESLVQDTCGNGTQRIELTGAQDGTVRLTVTGTQRVFGTGGSTQAGARIVPEAPSSSAGQSFRLVSVGSRYAIQNVASGLCVEVQGSATQNGTALVQSACTASPAQSFTFSAL